MCLKSNIGEKFVELQHGDRIYAKSRSLPLLTLIDMLKLGKMVQKLENYDLHYFISSGKMLVLK